MAEDEDAIRGIAERVLKDLGYNVLSARNGEEAIELFNGNQVIDLAVLDLMMPRKGEQGGVRGDERKHARVSRSCS